MIISRYTSVEPKSRQRLHAYHFMSRTKTNYAQCSFDSTAYLAPVVSSKKCLNRPMLGGKLIKLTYGLIAYPPQI